MSDTISRDAAIDALNGVSKHYRLKGREWHPQGNPMIDAIKEVPSAEVTLCHLGSPCEYQNADIAMPPAEPMRWIPVSERLPKDNEYVLVTTAEGGVTDAEYWHRERIWVKNLAIMHVTAWMPLPEPWRRDTYGKKNAE